MAKFSLFFVAVLIALAFADTGIPGGQTALTDEQLNSDEFKERTQKSIVEINKKKQNSLPECVEFGADPVPKSGTSQVVAGIKYILTIHIKPAKSNAAECAAANVHLSEELHQDCEVEIWEKSWENFQQITVNC